jgi:hypothetical protein
LRGSELDPHKLPAPHFTRFASRLTSVRLVASRRRLPSSCLCPSCNFQSAKLQLIKTAHSTALLASAKLFLILDRWLLTSVLIKYPRAFDRTCLKANLDLAPALDRRTTRINSTARYASVSATIPSDHAPWFPSKAATMHRRSSSSLELVHRHGMSNAHFLSSSPDRASSPHPGLPLRPSSRADSSASSDFHFIRGREESYSDQGTCLPQPARVPACHC